MADSTIRAVTPLCLALLGVVIIGIGVAGRSFGKLDTTDFNTMANISFVAIGGAAGTAQSSSRKISAENVENIDMDAK